MSDTTKTGDSSTVTCPECAGTVTASDTAWCRTCRGAGWVVIRSAPAPVGDPEPTTAQVRDGAAVRLASAVDRAITSLEADADPEQVRDGLSSALDAWEATRA